MLTPPPRPPHAHPRSVDVTRSGPDNQRGFQWTVTFTSELNGGNVDQMVPVTTDLKGTGASAVVTTLTDGNELDGTFNVTFGLGMGQVRYVSVT